MSQKTREDLHRAQSARGLSWPWFQHFGGARSLLKCGAALPLLAGLTRLWKTNARTCPRSVVLLLALLDVHTAWAGVPEVDLIPASLRVGFTKNLFLDVNRNDAEASFKVLADIVGQKQGYTVQLETRVFDDVTVLEAAIKDGSILLSVVDAWQFLSMDIQQFMRPYFISADQGKVGKKYVLLTRRGSGLNSLADLRGKDIAELEASGVNLGLPWLETLLLGNGLGTQTQFFGSVEMVRRPSGAVLPVFFGKKQACVVDESGYEVMKELNPQVGRQLQVIATSDLYANSLICLTHSGWTSPDYKKTVIENLAGIHKEPSGQQILTLFKTGRLIPFEEPHLDTVRKLRNTYDRLRKDTGL